MTTLFTLCVCTSVLYTYIYEHNILNILQNAQNNSKKRLYVRSIRMLNIRCPDSHAISIRSIRLKLNNFQQNPFTLIFRVKDRIIRVRVIKRLSSLKNSNH